MVWQVVNYTSWQANDLGPPYWGTDRYLLVDLVPPLPN